MISVQGFLLLIEDTTLLLSICESLTPGFTGKALETSDFGPLDQMYWFANVLFKVVYENFSLALIAGNIFSSIIFNVDI